MFWSKKSDPKTVTMGAKRTYEVMMKSPEAYSKQFLKNQAEILHFLGYA